MSDSYRDSIEGVRQEEIATLRARVAVLEDIRRAARSLLSRDDFWASAAMLVTLPGEIDNLADALSAGESEGER